MRAREPVWSAPALNPARLGRRRCTGVDARVPGVARRRVPRSPSSRRSSRRGAGSRGGRADSRAHAADVEEPRDDVALVVERELHGDDAATSRAGRRRRRRATASGRAGSDGAGGARRRRARHQRIRWSARSESRAGAGRASRSVFIGAANPSAPLGGVKVDPDSSRLLGCARGEMGGACGTRVRGGKRGDGGGRGPVRRAARDLCTAFRSRAPAPPPSRPSRPLDRGLLSLAR